MFAPQDRVVIDELLLSGGPQAVAFRLCVEDDAIVLDREVLDKQAVSHRLFSTAGTAEELSDLLADDDAFDGRRHQAQRLVRAGAPRLAATAARLPADPFELAAAIAPGASQPHVTRVLRALGATLQLPQFLAVWLRRHGEGHLSTRLLAGCNAGWARAMVARRWCVSDPLLTHARARNEVIGSWQIARLSPGQEAASRLAAESGLAARVCVPVHEAGGQATLALVFGAPEMPEATRFERLIVPALQAAALRLLTWARERRWREEHGSIVLTETQRQILTLLAQDFMTMDIAQLLGEPEGRITYHIKRLRGLFGAHSGVEVALKAMEAGLIDPMDRA
jgi:DNA-binding CsgD family transcriptional regulator